MESFLQPQDMAFNLINDYTYLKSFQPNNLNRHPIAHYMIFIMAMHYSLGVVSVENIDSN